MVKFFVVGTDIIPLLTDVTVSSDIQDAIAESKDRANKELGTRFKVYELVERGSAIATPAQYYETLND